MNSLRNLLQEIQRKLSDVEKLEFETGPDSDGNDAIWVWVVIRSDAPEKAWAWENRQRIRSRVIDKLKKAGKYDWIYVRFRSADEEAPSEFVDST